MTSSRSLANVTATARVLVVALISSLLVLAGPLATESKADYTSFTSYTSDAAIEYNDQVCNLGDPNDHSTSATAFEISTSEQLWEVTDCVSNSATIYFELVDDIDVSGSTAPTTSPIGFSTSSVVYSFSGVLNAKNNKVSGLSISTNANVGLFSAVKNATISNLVIAGSIGSTAGYAGALAAVSKGNLSLVSLVNEASVSGNGTGTGGLIGQITGGVALIESSSNFGSVESSMNRVGGLIGESFATSLVVSSSQNSGTVSAADIRVGGLIGDAGIATIRDSHNSGMVEGSGSVGGLVGYAFFNVGATGDVIVEDSSNSGSVSATTGESAGGLVGSTDGFVTVRSSQNSGTISAATNQAGGLVGKVGRDVTIYSSNNTGSIEANSGLYAGGLVGYAAENASVSQSHNTGAISAGTDQVGGLFGRVQLNLVADSSYNNGPISGSQHVGGLVGMANQNAQFSASQNTGTVSGTSRIGGLAGWVNNNANVLSSLNSGPIDGSDRVGGLIGYSIGTADISSSRNLATISASSEYAGGLIGHAFFRSNIINSQNTGAVSTVFNAGGLIGQTQDNTKIEASHNTGRVSATSDRGGGLVGRGNKTTEIITSFNSGQVVGGGVAGGLIGQSGGGPAIISSSYNAGNVTGSTYAAGLVGLLWDNGASITVSLNRGSLTGSGRDGLVIKQTGNNSAVNTTSAYSSVDSAYVATTPVADMKVASTFVGFDFVTVWGFGTCTENNGLPMLRVFAQVGSYYASGCYTAPVPDSVETPAPAPVYSGPVIDSALTVQAGTEATFTGNRLDSVTAAFVGEVQLLVVAVESQSLVLEVASSLSPGTYDLVIQSSFGTLTFQQGLTVLASSTEDTETETSAESEQVDQKLTVGAFQGFIAIYTKGYEGQKLSAKVAGKWLVAAELNESWNGNDYSRTLRAADSGYDISVHLYIDGKFMRTHEIKTK